MPRISQNRFRDIIFGGGGFSNCRDCLKGHFETIFLAAAAKWSAAQKKNFSKFNFFTVGGHSPMLLGSGKSQKSLKKVGISMNNLRKTPEQKSQIQ